MEWYRVTFAVPGYTPIAYEVPGTDAEDAYRTARWKHLGDSWKYSGGVYIEHLPDGPTVTDKSFSMDDLADINKTDEDLPF